MRNLPLGTSVWAIPGYVAWTRVANQGVAFGLGAGMPGIVTVLQALACGLVVYLTWKWVRYSLAGDIGLGLLTAGLVGNLADRAIRGAVVDFINLMVWPVFNVADVLVVGGVVVLGFQVLYRLQHR